MHQARIITASLALIMALCLSACDDSSNWNVDTPFTAPTHDKPETSSDRLTAAPLPLKLSPDSDTADDSITESMVDPGRLQYACGEGLEELLLSSQTRSKRNGTTTITSAVASDQARQHQLPLNESVTITISGDPLKIKRLIVHPVELQPGSVRQPLSDKLINTATTYWGDSIMLQTAEFVDNNPYGTIDSLSLCVESR